MELSSNFYENNCNKFSDTRFCLWDVVRDFGKQFKKDSYVLDAGCGNGKNIYYFQSKRWDIELENNVLLKLPKDNIKTSLDNSFEFINFNNFLNNKTIDTRIENQIIVNERRNKS